ncbi:hypothetical protein DSL72_008940 [Monilinia vaccinii-corymbosi]|uniref:Ketoreductase domain-containing protein n=1 Tax=Monilinia vaccinii-corymbosi TaxID=61207 RepID=A0A8A3PRQ5_9HELO|nr:hypothetical protein DSL72_008940 [Monilinia vaccinii-corymbosi]
MLIFVTLENYVQGHTTPIRPIEIFDASETQDAFRYMQKGLCIGRVGLRLRPSSEACEQRSTSSHLILEVTERTRQTALSPSASYFLIGGLGGLEKAISAWMVEHDARELILLSRSAGQGSNDELFTKELESVGCNVKLVKGEVENLDDVSKAVALATLPLKGIIQMSMVLRDQTFETMRFEDWKAAIGPKVGGRGIFTTPRCQLERAWISSSCSVLCPD